jgi:hypothetical protein
MPLTPSGLKREPPRLFGPAGTRSQQLAEEAFPRRVWDLFAGEGIAPRNLGKDIASHYHQSAEDGHRQTGDFSGVFGRLALAVVIIGRRCICLDS